VARHLFFICALSLLTFFAGLGRGAIGDSDEAFYAEAAREMVESGNWLTPHYNYELRFQKPILYYWMVATTYHAGGVSEAAARFPSAVSGLLLALLTYFCGRRWFDPPTAALAGAIVATSFGYFVIGRASLPDLPLALFIAAATWALIEALGVRYRDEASRPGVRRFWLVIGTVAMALGMLTKGPVAIALPILTALVVALRERRAAGDRPIPWPGLKDVAIAAGVFLLIAVPWYAAMVNAHGFAYLERFFVAENLERFATERYNESRPIWFYVPILLGGLMPWAPFVLLWVPSFMQIVVKRRRTLTSGAWRLIVWAAVPLIFYSLSIGKQPRYILPVLPPMALILARSIMARLPERGEPARRHLLLGLAGTLAAISLLVLALLLNRARPLLFALNPSLGWVGTTVIVIAGLSVLVAAWMRRRWALPGTLAVASVATFLALQYSIASAAGLEPVQRMAALYRQVRGEIGASGTYRVFVRNLVFYTGAKQTDLTDAESAAEFMRSDTPVVCVVSADDLRELQTRHGIKAVRLGEVTYFNPAGVRLGTLLWPDPEKHLETVVLVSNKETRNADRGMRRDAVR
jgi:4-amino-4-deoxy-L-arabinose transferase-like glycosyltransferase